MSRRHALVTVAAVAAGSSAALAIPVPQTTAALNSVVITDVVPVSAITGAMHPMAAGGSQVATPDPGGAPSDAPPDRSSETPGTPDATPEPTAPAPTPEPEDPATGAPPEAEPTVAPAEADATASPAEEAPSATGDTGSAQP